MLATPQDTTPRPDPLGHGHARFDNVLLVADDGAVVHASRGLRHLLGSEPATAPPVTITSVLHAEDRSQVLAALATVRDSGDPATCHVRLRADDGTWHGRAVLLEAAAGTRGGLVTAIVHDDDAHERTSDLDRLLRRITAAANDTSETAALFDLAVADVEATMGWRSGRVLPGVPSDDDGRASPAASQARRSAQPASSGLDAASATVAVPVMVEGAVAAVLEFTSDGPVGLDPDVSSSLGEVGRHLGSVLERERIRARLDERSADLQRSNSELERFAYVASHDLQEPLRKIVGFSELLADRYADQLDEDGREYLGYVVDATRRLQQLIKDLLAYSRAGRTAPVLVDVDLAALTALVLDTLEWTIEEAGARVTVGDLPTVRGDENQLAEVLTNLLANAVKYATDDGASITVAAERAESSDVWELTVADDGIGIDPRFADQVFEVFRRLHGPGEYRGTGIGLAITKRFVEANGGRVWVTPNTPRGAVFHVTLHASDTP